MSIAELIAKYPNWKPSDFVKARLKEAYDSGHKAGHDEAIERAAQLCTQESNAFRAEVKLCSPESREFYDAKSRALINIAAEIRRLARQADSAEGK